MSQHARDTDLMSLCIDFFQAGSVIKNRSEIPLFLELVIKKKVLPLFNEAPILGNKAKDFKDWSEVLYIMNRKEHLTLEGIVSTSLRPLGRRASRKLGFAPAKIRKIKEGIKSYRK